MGYLSCRAESSVSTCRSIAAVSPSQTHNNKKKNQSSNSNNNQQDDQQKQQQQDEDDNNNSNSNSNSNRFIEQFSYAELESATGNFSESSLLGRGSHGSVYRATLPRRRPSVVAVKRPSPRPALSPSPSRNEVENEIEILSKIHSPGLVNLIGFTPLSSSSSSKSKNQQQQQQQRLLVVEFMPNGTLYDFLHTNPRPPRWPRRLRFALQTAKALLTLHSASPPLIHRDVKSANILIDRSFNARLGDFGLALRLDDLNAADSAFPSSCRSTPPAGTLGYLDPCYVTPDNLSTKTDVFSFGILLLEIMSGRKAIDVAHSPPSVVEWAVPLLRKGKVGARAIYDPRISPPKDSRVRRQLAVLAASCVRSSDERRPSMEEVVEQLKVLSKAVNAAAKAWNGLSVVNPCSAVETQGTLSKASSNGVKSNAKLEKEMGRKEEEEEVPAGIKKPPLPVSVNSSVKATRPMRNGNKVFLDEEAKRGGWNLMELLARPDGEFIELCGRRSSVIRRAKTLRVTSEYYGGDGNMRLQRNQTVKGVQFESLVISDGFQNSDKRIHGQARHVI